MASAGGFSFGGAPSSSSSLFGAKTTASLFSFGSTATTATASTAGTGFSFGSAAVKPFGAVATATTTASAFSFGATTSAPASTSATGFSFGFGATTTAVATTSSGSSFFSGFKPATTSAAGTGLFGAKSIASTGLFSATSTATSSAAQTKPLENPKEANVPNELTTLVTDLETHIKSQKDVKEEISKVSTEGINTTRDEIAVLKQSIALIANSLQRDSVAVENLKLEVGQELKNAEIAQRIKDITVSLHHDFSAPMEYFQRLVYSFETRINVYRREIEELETFISSSVSSYQFTPQDLSNVLKRLNDSFVGLASELQEVHESVKVIKEKYLHFRRVVYNDSFDPFGARKKQSALGSEGNLVGPSPFPVVQGAGIMASAFTTETKASTIGFSNLSGLSSTFAKPAGTGLTRSLSFGGSGTKSTTFGGFGTGFGGSSLFGKTPTTNTSSFGVATTSASPFTLQKPPSGKRGKLF